MNYQQTIEYLFSRLPMFSKIGANAIKNGLRNIISLCDALNNPQEKFKSIHVAGTNGKGSVSHMLAAILQSSGLEVGLYTSPHLKDFRERIRVNGKMVEEEYVVAFTNRINPLIEKIEPSFFEITVAMAFEYFALQEVDVAVIEVGLGGRLDSTNIITPELSVITNIGRDHMQFLGETLEEIAAEKAGIIKPGVPVIIGEVLPETQPVFERIAKENKSKMVIASEKRKAIDWRWEKNELIVEIADEQLSGHETYHLDLTGIYQCKNLVTVLETCKLLQESGWNMESHQIHEALRQVKKLNGLHGRWEQIHQHPRVILDVAHNVDGMRQLVRQLESTSYKHLHIVIGMVKDKEIDEVIRLLPHNAVYYFTKAQIPRAIPENELMQKANEAGLIGQSYREVNLAIQAALSKSQADDLILVCGSVFLAGEVNPSFHPASAIHT